MTPAELKIDKKKTKLKEIYDCLMFSQCMIQYNKYGDFMPLEQQFNMYDFRVAQQFLFYIVFSVFTGMLSNKDQTRGISFARAIGIIFLLNELEQLLYYQKQIENVGQDINQNANELNQRLEFINRLFPSTYCVFEKIEIQRFVYFLIFNLSCCISQIYELNNDEVLASQMHSIGTKQKELNDLCKELYKKANNGVEFKRKPMNSA